MSRWKFEDIMDKMMPLFEQKVAWSIEREGRELSLKERTEERKLDLEYRKLEAQITTDKDKLAWEKEKLTTAVKADYDLQTLKNTGLLDTERLKGLNEKDLQGIKNAGLKDTEMYKANMEALPKLFVASKGQKIKNADGTETITPDNPEAAARASALSQRLNLEPAAATPQARNVAGEAAAAIGILNQHEINKTPDQARTLLANLPADTRQEVLKQWQPGAPVAPVTGRAAPVAPPVAPAPVAPAPAPAAAPAAAPALTPDANAEIFNPQAPPAPAAAPAPARFLPGKSPRELQAMAPEEYVQARKQAATAPVRPNVSLTQTIDEEEKRKKRASNQVRNLTSINFPSYLMPRQ
jgi:hypothetical protein